MFTCAHCRHGSEHGSESNGAHQWAVHRVLRPVFVVCGTVGVRFRPMGLLNRLYVVLTVLEEAFYYLFDDFGALRGPRVGFRGFGWA